MSAAAPSFIPGTPYDPQVSTYTRFAGGDLEAYEYSGWVDETLSWKHSCYVGNWSTLRKSILSGPEALRLLSHASINGFAKYEVGQAKHVVMCTDQGHVAGEGVLLRLSDDEHLLTSSPAVVWLDYLASQGQFDVSLKEVTRDWFILQLQGPQSLHVLERVAGARVRDIGFMRFRELRADNQPFFALRQGMSGEIGFELHGHAHFAEDLYAKILEAGQDYGIRRLGGRSKMVNHTEASFPTPSVDFAPAYVTDPGFLAKNGQRPSAAHAGSFVPSAGTDFYRSPIELGWSKSIRWDHDFIGKDALRAEFANPRRKIVSLIWNREDVADIHASYLQDEDEPYDFMEYPRNLLGCIYADRVEKDGQAIGVATSRTYSLHFRQMISLCVIDVARTEAGTTVEVIWGAPGRRQKRIRATVAPAPLKQDQRRADLTALPLL